ncbi:hypothetical protein [Streptomyces acidiscabies]|uniref:hypothetical protein n=1 Tax=Streptomyces acidiscabies TaxID=42234 RepID=UPI000A67C4AD|nr:hypothetical protein [Streptomyces acidiscabies]
MQRPITKFLATSALLATAVGIAFADNGQSGVTRQASSTVHTLSACWPGPECWGQWS